MPGFYESVRALGESLATSRVVRALVLHAQRQPEQGAPIAGTRAHVVHSRRPGEFPPLRLFYRYDAEAVYLYYVERVTDGRDRSPARAAVSRSDGEPG